MPNQNKPTLDEILETFESEVLLRGYSIMPDVNNKTKQAILRLFDERYIQGCKTDSPDFHWASSPKPVWVNAQSNYEQSMLSKLEEDGYIEEGKV